MLARGAFIESHQHSSDRDPGVDRTGKRSADRLASGVGGKVELI